MKLLFWLSSFTIRISTIFSFQGFVNVYFKNYNGGRQSSSGSIVYWLIMGILLLIAGFAFYFNGRLKIAALIMGLPILLFMLFLFFQLLLPYFMGERMN